MGLSDLTEGLAWLEWLRERFTRRQREAVAGEDPSRRRWGAIIVCVLLAVVLWFTLSIRETYTIQVEMPTQVVNLPDDMALVALPPPTVQVQVSGEGFDLFGLRFNPPTLMIDAQDETVNLLDMVILPSGIAREGVNPRTITFQKEARISRTILIRSRAVIEPAEAHDFIDPHVLSPDSIVVTGAESIINDLEYWPSAPFRHTDLLDSLVVVLPLADTLVGLVEKSHHETTLTAVAAVYTEGSRMLQVRLGEVPTTHWDVSLEPPRVRVTYRVPLSQYEQAQEAEDFYATVSYSVIRSDTTGRVRPEINYPRGIALRNTDYSPSTLRYYVHLDEQ